jgi:hypothetical protein
MTDYQIQSDVIAALANERAFQDRKHGAKPHDLSLWVLIIERELAEVKDAIIKKTYDEARCELLQVGAVCVAALEQHGVIERRAADHEGFTKKKMVVRVASPVTPRHYFCGFLGREASATWTQQRHLALQLAPQAVGEALRSLRDTEFGDFQVVDA